MTLALYFGRLNWVEYGVFSPSALPNDKLQVAAAAAVQALTARVWGGNTKGVLAPKYLILLIKYIHTYIYIAAAVFGAGAAETAAAEAPGSV